MKWKSHYEEGPAEARKVEENDWDELFGKEAVGSLSGDGYVCFAHPEGAN